jgi:hypothetical protein
MLKALLSLSLVVAIVGCASEPVMSPQQRRQLQTRTFEHVSFKNVFRAFKTVLQDEGYLIKNQDMVGGLIVATIEKTDSSSGFWQALAGNSNYRTGEGFEVSINLEQVGETVEARMTLQKLEQYSHGGQKGKEILDPALYKSFFAKVKTEVERRKAQGKS